MAVTLLADGFEDAFLGFGLRFTHTVAVYSYARCVKVLMDRDGMSAEDADEYMQFNVIGAYVGECTPVFMMEASERDSESLN